MNPTEVHVHRYARLSFFALIAALLWVASAPAQELRSRSETEWRVKAEKLESALLPLMRRHGVDLWLILSRENHPDPALDLFGGYGVTGWYGHRNAYLLADRGEAGLERVLIGTHQSGHMRRFFPRIVSYGEEGLAPHLAEYVADLDPEVIAINRSRTISMADGLTASLEDYLLEALGAPWTERLVSSEPLLIDYVSHRTPAETAIAEEASWRTWNILRRAFSNEVVVPGETTLMDLHWWVVEEWHRQGLTFNFPAGFSLQRAGGVSLDDADDPVIQRGDLLHVDFGVRLMGIVTDQQKMAYVLREGESGPPGGMVEAFAQSVRLGEIIAEELVPGAIGHEVKGRAERRAREEGIDGSVYSHAQGNWVHDAGAWAIFDWPERYGAHPREPVRPTEFWSIEYSVSLPLPEWDGQTIRMAREEDAQVLADGTTRFLAGPQQELWIIR